MFFKGAYQDIFLELQVTSTVINDIKLLTIKDYLNRNRHGYSFSHRISRYI